MSASAEILVRAAAGGALTLTGEASGYLVLGAADALGNRPRLLDLRSVIISETGVVTVLDAPSTDPAVAVRRLQILLGDLLRVAVTSSAQLKSLVDARCQRVDDFVRLLEAALVPVNRSAGKRVLARSSRQAAAAKVSRATTAPSRDGTVPIDVSGQVSRGAAKPVQVEDVPPPESEAPASARPATPVPDVVVSAVRQSAVVPLAAVAAATADGVSAPPASAAAASVVVSDVVGTTSSAPPAPPAPIASLSPAALVARSPEHDAAEISGETARRHVTTAAPPPAAPPPAAPPPAPPAASRPPERRARRSALSDLMDRFHVSDLGPGISVRLPVTSADKMPEEPLAPARDYVGFKRQGEPSVFQSETPPPAVPDAEEDVMTRAPHVAIVPSRMFVVGGVVGALAVAALVARGPATDGLPVDGNEAPSVLSLPASPVAAARSGLGEVSPAGVVQSDACRAVLEVVGAKAGAEITLIPEGPEPTFEPRKAVGPLARFTDLPCGSPAGILVQVSEDADSWMRIGVSSGELSPLDPAAPEAFLRVSVPRTTPR